ncbi:MAG: aminodeoxychorismate lyase [Dyella sp.]
MTHDAAVRVLVNGVPASTVSAFDRGLGYGDGLFETIRFVGARAPLWPRHMQRLTEGCARLGLPPPDPLQLAQQATRVNADLAHSVVRITLTRGIGERGYAPPACPMVTTVVAAFAPPPIDPAIPRDGVALHLCQLRLALQPRLAGIKHLNRLEQVLARAEWNDPAIGEGVLLDSDERVISAVAANLFAVIDGVPCTPSVQRCGVAGVARAEVLAANDAIVVRDLDLDALLRADEVWLSSSVRGIVPVRRLDGRQWSVGPITRALQAHWHSLGFSMEPTS